jgi:nitrogen fixation NifU-like protein
VAIPEPQFDELYRELILQHYRHPRNRGRLPGAALRAEGANPVCGDEVTIELEMNDGRIARAAFEGQGCSISQASASMLTETVAGKTVAEVRRLADAFERMLVNGEPPAPELGDLEAFQGVSKFPVRVKCALLSWKVLQRALEGAA